jgi:uncharacterized membrane protein YheB (UPF0754 family)
MPENLPALFAVLPLISALIGWLTNRLAIQMLFRPRKAWKFLGLRVQGLIPKRQKEMAERIGEIVEKELLSDNFLQEKLTQFDLAEPIARIATQVVHNGVAPRLRRLPLLGGFINDGHLAMLQAIAVEEMTRSAPALLNEIATQTQQKLDIAQTVRTRVEAFDLEALEQLIRSLAQKEFRAIEWLGGILGLIVGLAQLAILALI